MNTLNGAFLLVTLSISITSFALGSKEASKENDIKKQSKSTGLVARLGWKSDVGKPCVSISNIAKDESFCLVYASSTFVPDRERFGASLVKKGDVWIWSLEMITTCSSDMAGLFFENSFGGPHGLTIPPAVIVLPEMPAQLKGKKFQVCLKLPVSRMPFPDKAKKPQFQDVYIMTDVRDSRLLFPRGRSSNEQTSDISTGLKDNDRGDPSRADSKR